MNRDIEQYGALAMVGISLLALVYLSVMHQNEQAAGALIAVVAAGNGFFLRGKVEK